MIGRYLVYFSFAAFLGGALTAPAMAASDDGFVKKAAKGGMAEVELSQLAIEKASNSEVKQFAQHIVDDHQKANTELHQLAQTKGIEMPDEIGAQHKQTKKRLSKLEGTEFDKAYMKAMVKDHKDDIKEFEKQAKSGKDAELKQWAAKTVPVLQKHMQMAQSLQTQVGGGK